MKTFLELKTEIRANTWAGHEGENLVGPHDLILQEGMGDLQKWIPCEQDFNVNVVSACSTWFKCGMSVFELPQGAVIRRVYSIANGDWCDPVFYRQRAWPAPEFWARNIERFTAPLNIGFPRLPRGFLYPEASSDMKPLAIDNIYGRARTGIWSIGLDKRLYVAPWLQSNESLVIEWMGRKTIWSDADPINPDILFRTALKLFLQYGHERDFGTPQEEAKFQKAYESARGDLIHECWQQRKERHDLDYDDVRGRTQDEIKDDLPPSPDEVVFAHIGNYGQNSTGEGNVSELARSWQPKFIITSGVNSYSGDYDADVGAFWHDFIFPYYGTHGNGAAFNLFWPAVSNKDWDNGNLSEFKLFFRLPNNERYYELVRGDVHFFFIDSDAREADGNGPASTQAAWLAAKAALSTAAWKVVVQNLPPYSSGNNVGSVTNSQWDFASMGINLVLSSGSSTYERLLIGGVNYIVNGLGGAPIETFTTPVSGSVTRFSDEFGALRLKASSQSLTAEFWDRYGFIQDTLSLTK